MARFNDLPDDIYFEVLKHLPPPDLGSFFCLNKHLYALTAGHRDRHQSLKQRYSTCLGTKQPGSAARLIKRILADPRSALYVQHFTLNGCHDGGDSSSQVNNDRAEYLDFTTSDIMQLELALRDRGCLSTDEVQEWISQVKKASEDTLIILALTLFPNLTSIDVQYSADVEHADDYDDYDEFFSFCCMLREMIRDSREEKSNKGPFAKLIIVTITASEGYSYFYHSLVEGFASLPSVKVINIDSITDFEEEQPLELTVARTSSKATDLNISNGDLAPARLMLLLQRFEWLQSFTYWPLSDDRQESDFDPFSIVVTLLACARDSLRELQIRAGSAPVKYMGSLRKFRVLEYLDTDFTLLFGDSNDSNQDFSSSLPPSIQEIKLQEWDSDGDKLPELFADLKKSRNELPRLRKIEVFGDHPKHLPKFRNMCAKMNISLKLIGHGNFPLPVYDRCRGHYAERHAKKKKENERKKTRMQERKKDRMKRRKRVDIET